MLVRDSVYGITPAHAGKSVANAAGYALQRDHPCTRGEKYLEHPLVLRLQRITPAHAGKRSLQAIWARQAVGSPLHTRGKAVSDMPFNVYQRITPAHAGKRLKDPVISLFFTLF